MAEREMPNRDQGGNEHDQQRDRRPEPRQPNERASRRDLGERDAARRQARQDPLQRRDR